MSTSTGNRSPDAIVIGGSLTGLFAALQLRGLGFKTLVIEGGDQWGGWDQSIVTQWGARFDMAFHVVDYERSRLVTRLVSDLLGGDLGVRQLERNIVIAGTMVPYAAPPAEWPANLQPLVQGCQTIDDIDDGAVTLAALRRVYGAAFIDHVINDIVVSYPTLAAQIEQQVPVEKLLLNIYPWFFPNVQRTGTRIGESNRYHEAMRELRAQRIIYPKRNGFAAITDAIRQRLAAAGVEMRKGVGPVRPIMTPDEQGIESLVVADVALDAHLYFWSAGMVPLFKQLGYSLPRAIPVEFLIGSFELQSELPETPHEILVGDPRLAINRISFPARLVEDQANTLVQIEFAVPKQSAPVADREWIERWTSNLAELGIVTPSNKVRGAEILRLPIAECLPGTEAAAIAPILERFDSDRSNLCLLSRALTPRNTNQVLPDAAARVAAFAAR